MSKIIHEVSFAIEATLLLSFILIRKRAFVALTLAPRVLLQK